MRSLIFLFAFSLSVFGRDYNATLFPVESNWGSNPTYYSQSPDGYTFNPISPGTSVNFDANLRSGIDTYYFTPSPPPHIFSYGVPDPYNYFDGAEFYVVTYLGDGKIAYAYAENGQWERFFDASDNRSFDALSNGTQFYSETGTILDTLAGYWSAIQIIFASILVFFIYKRFVKQVK